MHVDIVSCRFVLEAVIRFNRRWAFIPAMVRWLVVTTTLALIILTGSMDGWQIVGPKTLD